MNEQEVIVTTEEPVVEPTNQMYLDQIQNLQNKINNDTVPKAQYEQLRADHANLLKSKIDGTFTKPVAGQATRTADDVRAELFKQNQGKIVPSLEYVTKMVELRDKVLEETGEDCFVMKNKWVKPTHQHYVDAERRAQIYKDLIAKSNGDDKVFRFLLEQALN